MLKRTALDDDLLSSIQQRLQTETDATLPFLRRLMKAGGLVLLIEHIFVMVKKGQPLEKIFLPIAIGTIAGHRLRLGAVRTRLILHLGFLAAKSCPESGIGYPEMSMNLEAFALNIAFGAG